MIGMSALGVPNAVTSIVKDQFSGVVTSRLWGRLTLWTSFILVASVMY